MDITIKSSDRVNFFGRTGCGKTTLARYLLRKATRPYVILDPKHDYSERGVPIVKRFDKDLERQIIRVEPDEYEMEAWDDTIYDIWRHRNRIIYADELTLISPARTLLPAAGRAIRTGRSVGVAFWAASQRPKDIPSAVFTETEHFFVFQLVYQADRDKVVSFTGDKAEPILPTLRGHNCMYYGVHKDDIAVITPPRPRA